MAARVSRICCSVMVLIAFFAPSFLIANEPTHPNILWLSAEDISPHLGCYGDPHAMTPNLDRLAEQGVLYTHAFTTAGVCAPCRSGIITGIYQTTLGTQHMRSQAKLPDFIKPFPTYLREAGYYCTNNSKQDYQFKTPKGVWDESSRKAHWQDRPRPDQPFFAVFNFTGCHESGIASVSKYETVTANLTKKQRQNPDKLSTLPPYYPDTPVTRSDWKRNYELITAMDAWAGKLIAQLKEDGLYENTIIFFWSDHGVGLPRAKRWLYDSGTHVPLIVRIPEKYRVNGQAAPGTTSDRLVSSIDFGPTVLNLAGLGIPGHIQGRPFLGPNLPVPLKYVFGARDRMDERYDIIRMVRDKKFKYIRNYEPLKTYYQYMNTPEKGATMKELRRLAASGNLSPPAQQFFATEKAVEELYDTTADPHELRNLAADPQYAEVLDRMRQAHLEWVGRTKDLGLIPEPLLVEYEKRVGDRYGILRQEDSDRDWHTIAKTAVMASQGPSALSELTVALGHTHAAVRYWAAVGLGNIGPDAISAKTALLQRLTDESIVVRVAAARALCRLGDADAALPVLVRVLENGQQWERLHAAIVLDEIDEQARPVIAQMRSECKPRKGLYADGKYTVRVLNRALNQLQGTDQVVP